MLWPTHVAWELYADYGDYSCRAPQARLESTLSCAGAEIPTNINDLV